MDQWPKLLTRKSSRNILAGGIPRASERMRIAGQGYHAHAAYGKIKPVQAVNGKDGGTDHGAQCIPCKSA